jgi:hypothetical protein
LTGKFMKTESGPPDNFLDQRLKEWRVDRPLPPRFQEQVWRRIEQEAIGGATNPWVALQQFAARWLPNRAWAAGYVAVALTMGLVLGYWQAGEKSTAWTANLGRQYVQSLDPYQMPRHGSDIAP